MITPDKTTMVPLRDANERYITAVTHVSYVLLDKRFETIDSLQLNMLTGRIIDTIVQWDKDAMNVEDSLYPNVLTRILYESMQREAQQRGAADSNRPLHTAAGMSSMPDALVGGLGRGVREAPDTYSLWFLLVWIARHDKMYTFWDVVTQAVLRIGDRDDAYPELSTVLDVCTRHTVLSFEQASQEFKLDFTVPWAWQEPLLFQQFLAYAANTVQLEKLYEHFCDAKYETTS